MLSSRNRTIGHSAININVLILLTCLPYVATQGQSFTDVTADVGINHQFEVFEGTFGGGAVAFDFNNDGYEDIFIAGGKVDDVLYMNMGNGTFKNVYHTSGLKTKKKFVTQGAISADVNKDGWRDLFITTITTLDTANNVPRAANLLFLNNGDQTFSDVTESFRLSEYLSFSTGACFGDVNLDGYPDIYVGNYFKNFSGELNILNDNLIVNSNQQAEGYLLINVNGKYFVNDYSDYGLTQKGFGFGGVFSDFDNDHDLDLLINNDFGYKSTPNFLMQNEYPDDVFEDVSKPLHMNLKINAMGTAVGDYNNDGLLDYHVTNIRANHFLVNQGIGKPFINRSDSLGTRISLIREERARFIPISWGTNFADFDNDTDLDLFVANGSLNPDVVPNPDYYFENVNGFFKNIAREKKLADYGIGRGSIVFDYDNDGDLDLLVVNQKPITTLDYSSKTKLYKNDSTPGNWIKVMLEGIDSDKNGIGAKVRVVIDDLHMMREIDGGSSHLSQSSTIAHFGLGQAPLIDSLIVEWNGGKKEIRTNQKVNVLIKITETNNVSFSRSVIKVSFFIFLALTLFLALWIWVRRRKINSKIAN
jgi:enediyne biosynthesis protein E4